MDNKQLLNMCNAIRKLSPEERMEALDRLDVIVQQIVENRKRRNEPIAIAKSDTLL